MSGRNGAPTYRVATVSGREDRDAKDVRLVSVEGKMSDTWMTVRRSSWPGKWPPHRGQLVTVVPAVVELAKGE